MCSLHYRPNWEGGMLSFEGGSIEESLALRRNSFDAQLVYAETSMRCVTSSMSQQP